MTNAEAPARRSAATTRGLNLGCVLTALGTVGLARTATVITGAEWAGSTDALAILVGIVLVAVGSALVGSWYQHHRGTDWAVVQQVAYGSAGACMGACLGIGALGGWLDVRVLALCAGAMAAACVGDWAMGRTRRSLSES